MGEETCYHCGRTIWPHTEACACGRLVNQSSSPAMDRATDPNLFMFDVVRDPTPSGIVGDVAARIAVVVVETVVPRSWKGPLGVLVVALFALWLVVQFSLVHPFRW